MKKLRLTKIQRQCLEDAKSAGIRLDLFSKGPPWLGGSGRRYAMATVRALHSKGLLRKLDMPAVELIAGKTRFKKSEGELSWSGG